jgi:RNA polymerase sigma factor (TIGR02999 family)
MRNSQLKADTAPSAASAPAAGSSPIAVATVEEWVPLLYDELRVLARRALRRENAGHSVTTTALVHEAYLKLGAARGTPWPRAHFFGAAARAMRQVLVDLARSRRSAKRGGGAGPLPLDEALVADQRADGLLELDDALRRLEDVSPRLLRVVECRYFGGLSEEETAEILGVTARTVRRDWVKAKGWLNQALSA